MNLLDWEHDLAGVRIGAGTAVVIRAIQGIGLPEKRNNDVEPAREDGLWAGADQYGGRLIRIDCAVRCPGDAAAALDILAELQEHADPDGVRLAPGLTVELRLKYPGRPIRMLRGRLRKAEEDQEQLVHGWLPIDIEFLATDPLYYSDQSEQTRIKLGTISTGGVAAPVVAPVVVGAVPTGMPPGTVTNPGTAATWPIIRIDGPCVNPVVTHVESKRTIGLAPLTLLEGQWVEIDTRPGWRTVLDDAGASRAALLRWGDRIDEFTIPPGRSRFQFDATDPTNRALLTVTWWPAWRTLRKDGP
ncbi:phage tail family protein (plasmid) [Kitasatospora sp. NBC_01246]|uniref:hypothetical protein n=1 Tax=Kitasatospora sp. NBC_01246 TaxID=2903570 RepID=UPI002E36A353|nr:hypothetical protein [Kitasatospora sp. NBC_01246]